MTNIAIIGFGNTGKGTYDAVEAAADMNLAGIVLRDKTTAAQKKIPAGMPVAEDVSELGNVDVAVLCTPTPSIPDLVAELLAKGIHTVDSYDIHTTLYDVKERLDPIAKQHNAVSVIAAGWDPGSDSVIRGLLEAIAPQGMTYTNFGPGMSMGHTVAAKAVPGVKDALSITIPLGGGLHRRMVYVEPMPGQNRDVIKSSIKADLYFINDDTHVCFVEDIKTLTDKGSGATITRKAVSGQTHNQLFTFNMSINNPALTGQVMTAAARAAMRQEPGCYTMIEIPVIDLLPGDKEKIIRRLV